MRLSIVALALAATAEIVTVQADGLRQLKGKNKKKAKKNNESGSTMIVINEGSSGSGGSTFKITINANDLDTGGNDNGGNNGVPSLGVNNGDDRSDRDDENPNNCPSFPQNCNGGANCAVFKSYNAALGGDKSDEYPLFNLDTCVYEPSECIDFKSMHTEAVAYVDGVDARVAATGNHAPRFTRDYRKFEEIMELGFRNADCMENCNGIGKCCRYHRGEFACDEAQDAGDGSYSTQKCICNDFTISPGTFDSPGFDNTGGGIPNPGNGGN